MRVEVCDVQRCCGNCKVLEEDMEIRLSVI